MPHGFSFPQGCPKLPDYFFKLHLECGSFGLSYSIDIPLLWSAGFRALHLLEITPFWNVSFLIRLIPKSSSSAIQRRRGADPLIGILVWGQRRLDVMMCEMLNIILILTDDFGVNRLAFIPCFNPNIL